MTDRKLRKGWELRLYHGRHRAADRADSQRRVLVGYLHSGRPLYVPRPR